MTPTHDTAAALEAAIRTFGVCAYSPSEPSDPYGIAGAHIWIEIEDYAAPLKAAITAHVEAEVALRLAAAPGVDLAIVRTVTAAHDHGVAAARCSRPEFGLARLEARADDAKREESALRAAIAADKARAVDILDAGWQAHDRERDAEVARAQADAHELAGVVLAICRAVGIHSVPTGEGWSGRVVEAVTAQTAADKVRAVTAALEGAGRAEQFADAICARVGARDSGCGGQTVEAGTARLYADAAKQIDAMIARAKARPTPDEARRLLDEYDHATRHSYVTGGPEHLRAARAALLRALGVEA